jgi:hypothetical protein
MTVEGAGSSAGAFVCDARCAGIAQGIGHILRHCERSEAIQDRSAAVVWIASLRSQ